MLWILVAAILCYWSQKMCRSDQVMEVRSQRLDCPKRTEKRATEHTLVRWRKKIMNLNDWNHHWGKVVALVWVYSLFLKFLYWLFVLVLITILHFYFNWFDFKTILSLDVFEKLFLLVKKKKKTHTSHKLFSLVSMLALVCKAFYCTLTWHFMWRIQRCVLESRSKAGQPSEVWLRSSLPLQPFRLSAKIVKNKRQWRLCQVMGLMAAREGEFTLRGWSFCTTGKCWLLCSFWSVPLWLFIFLLLNKLPLKTLPMHLLLWFLHFWESRLHLLDLFNNYETGRDFQL